MDAVKELQIPKQVARLSSLCDRLNDSMIKLMDRTKTVRFDRPQTPAKQSTPTEAKVPLAEELGSIASRIELHIMSLDEATNSLEI